jgi:hypothetical protein
MKKCRPGVRLRSKGHKSSYAKYGKTPYNYVAMYNRYPHLRPTNPNSGVNRSK